MKDLNLDYDNLLAVFFIGITGITAMLTGTTDSQIATAVVSGLIGYIAKVNKR